jgi:hypothetical protein
LWWSSRQTGHVRLVRMVKHTKGKANIFLFRKTRRRIILLLSQFQTRIPLMCCPFTRTLFLLVRVFPGFLLWFPPGFLSLLLFILFWKQFLHVSRIILIFFPFLYWCFFSFFCIFYSIYICLHLILSLPNTSLHNIFPWWNFFSQGDFSTWFL